MLNMSPDKNHIDFVILSSLLQFAETSQGYLEKEMATHSSIFAWRIPGTEEPGGLLSMGLHRVGLHWNDLAAAAAQGYLISVLTVIECNKWQAEGRLGSPSYRCKK